MAIATPPAHPQTEAWLQGHGATFELKTIIPAEINDRRSLQNQARFQPLDEHLVVTYAEAMADGAIFPPIVVAQDAVPGGYLILDGNHRFAAAKLAGKERIEAYITSDLSERQIMVLTFDANTKHGLPTSAEERKQHAVYLVETAGISQKEASSMLNVPARELQNEISRVRADKRLARLAVERWDSLAKSTRARLDNIRDDVVLKAAADLAVQAKLAHDSVAPLVTEINQTSAQADALAVVAAERERRKAQIKMTVGGRTRMPTDVVRLSRSVAYAERLVVERIDPAALDAATRASFAARIEAAIVALGAARDRLAS
jgi:ParB-like chromosome segregation protein Spo0J